MSSALDLVAATVNDLCAANSPQSILIAGLDAQALTHCCQSAMAGAQVTRSESISAVELEARFDLAILLGISASVASDTGAALIARLRDVQASHLVVALLLEGNPDWDEASLRSLGLKRLRCDKADEGQLAIYDFTLSNYKSTPKWLNNKHWANPDLWDRFRW
ncbi:MAG: DUF6231 family protein [Pseudomonadota bacterium]